MSKSNEIVLSAADITRMNIGKKRKLDPFAEKDSLSKKNRDAGLPYKGSNEISSCVWDYCTSKFQPLGLGEKRTLVLWMDRCIGQNNNFIVLNMLMCLVWKRFFNVVDQKLLMTGHSYNCADRDFGLIEKCRRSASLMKPSDIEAIIQNSRTENPFNCVWLDRQKFKDFKFQSTLLRRPPTLKVTKSLWFRYDATFPGQILTRQTHANDLWQLHNLNDLVGQPLIQFPTFSFQLLRNAYDGGILLESGKTKDLKKLMQYLSGPDLQFYENLMLEQDTLRENMENSE